MGLMKEYIKILKIWFLISCATGIAYPLLITGIAQILMRERAQGGLLMSKGQSIGALLIAQQFERTDYFWGRPSSIKYNPLPSGGSNLSPTSEKLQQIVREHIQKLALAHGTSAAEVPSELVFTSGSGLDPHISIKAAQFQLKRVAASRRIEEDKVLQLIDSLKSHGLFQDAYINVLQLNHALDQLALGS